MQKTALIWLVLGCVACGEGQEPQVDSEAETAAGVGGQAGEKLAAPKAGSGGESETASAAGTPAAGTEPETPKSGAGGAAGHGGTKMPAARETLSAAGQGGGIDDSEPRPSPAQPSGGAGGSDDGKEEGSAGTTECVDGTERCPCYGNGTCNEGLVCASDLCVDLGSGGQAGTVGSGGDVSIGGRGDMAGAAGVAQESIGGAAGEPAPPDPCDGIDCPPDHVCEAGECICPNPDVPDSCGTFCTNLSNGGTFCGECGHRCEDWLSCVDGECRCQDDATLCEQTNGALECVSLRTNLRNCGACRKRCLSGHVCDLGCCVQRPAADNDPETCTEWAGTTYVLD